MTLGLEPPQLLRRHLSYRGRKFDFEVDQLRLPNGVEGQWECIRHPGGALAVPVTATGEFILVRQYRFAVQGRLLEFPAGTVEPGESPQVTIAREIQEEIGYRAHTWRSLGPFPLAPGYSDEFIHPFLATDLEPLPLPPAGDADEDIEVVIMNRDRLQQAILTGEGVDAKTIASFFLALSCLAA